MVHRIMGNARIKKRTLIHVQDARTHSKWRGGKVGSAQGHKVNLRQPELAQRQPKQFYWHGEHNRGDETM